MALRLAPKTWLVTGVAGFIGSNLLLELLRCGQRRLRAGQVAPRGSERGFGVLQLLAAHGAAGQQRAAPGDVGLGARQLGLHAGQLGLALADAGGQCGVLRVQRAHLAHGLRQLRLGALQRQLRVGGVQPHQQAAHGVRLGLQLREGERVLRFQRER